jgi:radical SAM superfamily enzyme YgiQ (UPF0313 family)
MLRNKNLTYSVSTRLDFLDEEKIAILEDSGCRYICVGIESPSAEVSRIIDKRLNVEKHGDTIRLLKKSRMVVNYGFIFGYLGETEKTIRETKAFVLKHGLLYSAFFANAFPDTKLYDMVKDRIPDEKIYMEQLFHIDLSRDYLINFTDIPLSDLYTMRDDIAVISAVNALGMNKPGIGYVLYLAGRLYLLFMRRFGLKFSFIKHLFESINTSIIKPMTKR